MTQRHDKKDDRKPRPKKCERHHGHHGHHGDKRKKCAPKHPWQQHPGRRDCKK